MTEEVQVVFLSFLLNRKLIVIISHRFLLVDELTRSACRILRRVFPHFSGRNDGVCIHLYERRGFYGSINNISLFLIAGIA